MRSILEELFYGNICPQNDCAKPDEGTQQLMEYISYHHNALNNTLTDQQKEIFEKFNDCYSELTTIVINGENIFLRQENMQFYLDNGCEIYSHPEEVIYLK